jgi:hypothetical protein
MQRFEQAVRLTGSEFMEAVQYYSKVGEAVQHLAVHCCFIGLCAGLCAGLCTCPGGVCNADAKLGL